MDGRLRDSHFNERGKVSRKSAPVVQRCRAAVLRNPEVPPVPGSYLIKAGIYDIHTGWPIARFGWDNVGRQFEITGSQSETDSRHRIDNDILNLDVDWMS